MTRRADRQRGYPYANRTAQYQTHGTMDAVSDQFPLYRPELERDACGIALVADALGRPSHETVERGLLALNRLSHRGATGGGTHAIDGAGILTDIPWALLEATSDGRAIAPSPDRVRALATLFLPRDAVREAQQLIDRVVRAAGWEPNVWRQVPVRTDVLAGDARASEPAIYHLVLSTSAAAEQPDLSLLRIRVRLLHETAAAGLRGVAVASISRRTVVYKALVEPKDLPGYFPDLADARFVSGVALAHQRFSTNTLARWDLSQPFHFIAHNGEINTISGNRQWMRARQLDEAALPGWSREAGALIPTTGSDSESLDAAVALLCANGLDLPLAMTRLVPPAWEKDPELTPDEAAFYECQAAVSEPWDGPASLAFSDGRVSGVRLDRNGFRPARFILTRDQYLLAGSETGLFDLEERDILKQGRLGPGQMIFVDREANTIQHGHEISRAFASARPYRLWVRRLVRHFSEETHALPALPAQAAGPASQGGEADQQRDLIIDQRLFGVGIVEHGVQPGPPRIVHEVWIHFESDRTARKPLQQLPRAEAQVNGRPAHFAQHVLKVEVLDCPSQGIAAPAQLPRRIVTVEERFGSHGSHPRANRKR